MTLPSETSRACPKCGRTVPAGQADCVCAARPRYWLHSRETILLLCFAGVVLAFAITGVAARAYHDRRRALAQEWHGRGATDLASGKPQLALADFRAALVYGRENVPDETQEEYELDLAEALAAAGRLEEGQSYLLDLWQRAPGNGRVNLELARLAARSGEDDAARQYFDGAISGVWEGNSDQIAKDRFDARLELYHYLLSRGESSSAQAVLLAAAASLPPDASMNEQVGQLMLDSGSAQQARTQFEQALRIDRQNVPALIGAGLASFDLDDDAAAVRYLEESSRGKREEKWEQLRPVDAQHIGQVLDAARATLAIDPFRAGMDAPERARRTLRSYAAAVTRLEACADMRKIVLPKASEKPRGASAQSNDLPGVYAGLMKMKSSSSESELVRDPRLIDPAMELVFAAEAAVTEQCGAPVDPIDIALARIARHPRSSRL